MTGIKGSVVCLNCLEFKKHCNCKIPDFTIRKTDWIISKRLGRETETQDSSP